jgi:predicted ABC-type ATPase
VSLKWEKRVLPRKLRFVGRSYRRRIPRWKEHGFHVTLHFIWLPNNEMAIKRVAARVAQGGHDIAIPDIRRRYTRGLRNLNTVYLPIVGEALVLNGAVRVLASLSEAE